MTDKTSRLTGGVRRPHARFEYLTTSYEVPSLSRPASTMSTGRPPSRRGALTPTLIVVALVVVGFIFFANVWTDVLWYRQLGFIAHRVGMTGEQRSEWYRIARGRFLCRGGTSAT